MVVAVHFPVCGDAGGFLFPAPAGSGVGGYRTKSADCPGGAGQGGVPTEPPGAVVHHDGDLGQVDVAVRVGQLGDPPGPGALGLGEQRVDARADPGVQDGGDVAGSGQVPGGDGGADDVGGVQAGQFGGVQRTEQPPGPVGELAAVPGRQRGHHELAVAVVAGGLGFGGPDRVQDGEVVGVGQVAAPGLGGRQFGAVAAQDVGEHGDRLERIVSAGTRRWLGGWESLAFATDAIVAGEFGGGPGAGLRVGGPGRGGEHVGQVGVGAAGHRGVQPLPVFGAGDQCDAGVHGGALGGVPGDRVCEVGRLVAGRSGRPGQ